jgi:long-chain fatty acid transport protein
LPLPGVIAIGVGYKATDDLTLAVDVHFVQWSAYKELKFDFDSAFGGATSKASPRKYKDAFIYRIGADYAVNKMLNVRAGTYFDQTPVQAGYMTPETPDANRIGLTFGAGIKPIENLSIDASLLFIFGQKRTQSQSDINNAGTQDAVQAGTYQQRAVVPGIQVSYQF